jgi:hypothetical protein
MARCTLCGNQVEGDLAEHFKVTHVDDLRGGRPRSRVVFAAVFLAGLAVAGLIFLINKTFCSDLIARC